MQAYNEFHMQPGFFFIGVNDLLYFKTPLLVVQQYEEASIQLILELYSNLSSQCHTAMSMIQLIFVIIKQHTKRAVQKYDKVATGSHPWNIRRPITQVKRPNFLTGR